MNKYILKQGLIGLCFILIVFVLGFIFIYLPFVSHLKEKTYDNFRLVASQKELITEQFISNSIEGVESLSSRTMISVAIGEYKENEITLDNLINYTQPKYADGTSVLNNLDGAVRVVDGNVIAKVPISSEVEVFDGLELVTITEYQIEIEDDNIFMIVISPIFYENDIVGHDIVRFDMADLFFELNKNEEEYTIINDNERLSLLSQIDTSIKEEDYHLFIKDQDIIYLSESLANSDNIFIKISVDIDILEEDIKEMTSRALIFDSILFFLSFAVIFYFISHANIERIKLVNIQKEIYQEKANRDLLTGFYTRHFFKDWVKKIKESDIESKNSFTVAMCDINGFKQYNDNFGHNAGDQALIDIGKIMKNHVRDSEIVIRYGGDEFLFVAKGHNQKHCEEVIKEINHKIKQKLNLSFAYGIAVAKIPDELEAAINQADKRMYKNKNN